MRPLSRAAEGAALDHDELIERRKQYLHEVIAALSTYLGTGGDMRIESSRDVEELTIAFKLSTAADYQAILATLTEADSSSSEA